MPRPYEVMIILDPTLDDETVRGEVDRATELIKARGGSPGRVERWGKRRLAYEIRKHREGNYVLVSADAEPAVMSDLSRALTLADGVLRHKVIHLPDKAVGKAARPLGTVGPDDGAPTSEPAAPTPAPAAVTAGSVTDDAVTAGSVTDDAVTAGSVTDDAVSADDAAS